MVSRYSGLETETSSSPVDRLELRNPKINNNSILSSSLLPFQWREDWYEYHWDHGDHDFPAELPVQRDANSPDWLDNQQL